MSAVHIQTKIETITRKSPVKSSIEKSATGIISIKEVDPDGKFIVVENTSLENDQDMSGWKLTQQSEGGRGIIYTFPPNFKLRPLRSSQIWAKEKGGFQSPPEEIVYEIPSWYTGDAVDTILYDKGGRPNVVQTQTVEISTTNVFSPTKLNRLEQC